MPFRALLPLEQTALGRSQESAKNNPPAVAYGRLRIQGVRTTRGVIRGKPSRPISGLYKKKPGTNKIGWQSAVNLD
jgi:hypothetical protein